MRKINRTWFVQVFIRNRAKREKDTEIITKTKQTGVKHGGKQTNVFSGNN